MSNYLNLSIGAPKRLAILRKANPADWRKARYDNFRNSGNCQGFNDKTIPVWYYMNESVPVRTIKPCHEIINMRHTGWFCDPYQESKAFGIVGSLPHGRFIAGYELIENDEQVFFADIFDNANDAAHAADSHAEHIADQEREHAERFDAAQKLESLIESKTVRLCECFALRHKFAYMRLEISRLIETIRESRETLESDYAGVL